MSFDTALKIDLYAIMAVVGLMLIVSGSIIMWGIVKLLDKMVELLRFNYEE